MALQDRLTAKTARAVELGASLVSAAAGVAVLTTVLARFAWPAESHDSQESAAIGTAALVGTEVSVGRHVKESRDAKVVILEFSDFECPYCRLYARDQYRVVLKELVGTGMADYAFRHFPLDLIHPRAFMASQAAECAGEQGRFWEMHDALFGGPLSDGRIRKYAVDVGLDAALFQMCLGQDQRQPIMDDVEEAKRVGIGGTPTFLIGVKRQEGTMRVTRVLYGAQGLSALRAAVEAAGAAP